MIYGLVYYEAPDEGCPDPGTGAAKVFGTVAYEGDLMKYNGNIELVEVNFSSTGGDDEPVSVITMLPGSWRDF